MNNNLEQLYRQVIMEHYKNPKNKGLINDEGYYTVHLNNPSCGDDVNVQFKIVDDVIVDIKHSGIGCSMCCSSASIMSETLKGKTTKEALEIIDNFYELVKGEKVNDKVDLGESVVYTGVSKFPARIKCVTLSWKAVEKGINDKK